MLHRHGFSHQVPARRRVERSEEAVTGWMKEAKRRRCGRTPGGQNGQGLRCQCPRSSGVSSATWHARSTSTFEPSHCHNRHLAPVDSTWGHQPERVQRRPPAGVHRHL
ncbi:winged helix-turn-helix domain-containing protein [Streptomyces hygroscopicus]|uniref:winged helix-turn-helix domain-containing protein n=1 Tax=Streptomyces hygroscopicus TaxID=1912 RepID=UPI0022403866|nr:winged helix-turn-helix domain-containing protein [Streptomyces hygroscopicus]